MTKTPPTTPTEPRYAVSGLGGGTSDMIRTYAAPFVGDLLDQAELAGHAVELPAISVGDHTFALSPGRGPAIAGGSPDLLIGMTMAIGGGLTASVIAALGTDIYTHLLREPLVNLANRIRNQTPPPPVTSTLLIETWFNDSAVLVQVAMEWDPQSTAPETLIASLNRANAIAAAFTGPTTATDGPPTEPRVVRINVGSNGAFSNPVYTDPHRRLFPPATSETPHTPPPLPATDETEPG